MTPVLSPRRTTTASDPSVKNPVSRPAQATRSRPRALREPRRGQVQEDPRPSLAGGAAHAAAPPPWHRAARSRRPRRRKLLEQLLVLRAAPGPLLDHRSICGNMPLDRPWLLLLHASPVLSASNGLHFATSATMLLFLARPDPLARLPVAAHTQPVLLLLDDPAGRAECRTRPPRPTSPRPAVTRRDLRHDGLPPGQVVAASAALGAFVVFEDEAGFVWPRRAPAPGSRHGPTPVARARQALAPLLARCPVLRHRPRRHRKYRRRGRNGFVWTPTTITSNAPLRRGRLRIPHRPYLIGRCLTGTTLKLPHYPTMPDTGSHHEGRCGAACLSWSRGRGCRCRRPPRRTRLP